MSKIDTASPEDREALKKEIVTEMKHDARRKKLLSCGGCLLLELIAVSVPFMLAAVVLAKSGFVQVPYLSSWLFKPAAPVRMVTPVVGANADQIVRSSALAAKFDQSTSVLTMKFTEGELTAMARDWLPALESSLPFQVKSMQIAVDPGVMDIFIVTPQNGHDTTIDIGIVPTVDAGALKLIFKDVKIGSFAVPNQLSAMLTPAIDRAVSEAMNKGLGAVGQLVKVDLRQGVIEFGIVPKMPGK